MFLVNQHTHTAAVLETQRRNGKVCRSTQVKRDTKYQKIHNGADKESASAYASLAVKVEARENLQGKHVTDDENAEWIELKRTKYPRLKCTQSDRDLLMTDADSHVHHLWNISIHSPWAISTL